jgi:mono/diheme cytochrome c family protein
VRVHPRSRKLMSWALGMISLAGIVAAAQTDKSSPKPYKELIYSVKGPDLYHAYCAACHGFDGKGNGPAAMSLKTKPADLTALAKNNGGRFPVAQIRKFISDEDPSVAAHGSREMPVWGPIFHQIEVDQDLGNVRLQNLIKYLESIQQK